MAYLGKSVEKEMHAGAKAELFKFARELRKNQTESEKVLWKVLREFRSHGFIFRRQHPIDIFIADFYCHKLKLIIEVDGEIHDNKESQEHDDGRSAENEKIGIRVIRFTNEQVLNNKDIVIRRINNYIAEITSPSLPGEGDQRG
jgi:very-short-patch-repair endonuclease